MYAGISNHGSKRDEIAIVLLIHREHIIEAFEIAGLKLASARQKLNPATQRVLPRASVGHLPDVVRRGPRALHHDSAFEAGLQHQGSKDPFGRRRPADVSETNETDVDGSDHNTVKTAPLFSKPMHPRPAAGAATQLLVAHPIQARSDPKSRRFTSPELVRTRPPRSLGARLRPFPVARRQTNAPAALQDARSPGISDGYSAFASA